MLYALPIESMLNTVRSFIDGMSLSAFNVSFNLSAYADDIVKSQQDVNNLGTIVERFCRFSDAQVNRAKSEALAVGDWLAGLPQLPDGLEWKRGGLQYLDVYWGDEDMVNKNRYGVLEGGCSL